MEIKFKKVHTAKDLTLSSLLFVAGIGFVLGFFWLTKIFPF